VRGVRDAQGRRGAGRLIKADEARVGPGRQRFDQVITLAPGDPLGNWRIRAEVDGKNVLDRPFQLYDSSQEDAGAAERRDQSSAPRRLTPPSTLDRDQ
jgi:hypothetical protein